jgi:ATP-dependent Clp protease ATP-binding subunit ClpA
MLSIKKIVIKFTDELKKSLWDKHTINLVLSENMIDHLAEVGYDKKMGARPLARKIDELIRVPLSKKILFEKLNKVTINIDYENNQVVFNTTSKLIGKVNKNGIIEVS